MPHADKFNFWSFELKKEIEPNRLRENFFQAVSNSSWANYSYLVGGTDLRDDKKKKDPKYHEYRKYLEDLEHELLLLWKSHGVGYIYYDASISKNRGIQIKAPRTEVNWEAASRLLSVDNEDIDSFFKDINLLYSK